jgi:hypothetical protein
MSRPLVPGLAVSCLDDEVPLHGSMLLASSHDKDMKIFGPIACHDDICRLSTGTDLYVRDMFSRETHCKRKYTYLPLAPLSCLKLHGLTTSVRTAVVEGSWWGCAPLARLR